MQFENDISLDTEKTLNFKVQLSLSENDLTLQLSDKKKTFVSSVNSARELLAIGTPQNCEGKNNLRLFFNSCKLLFSKASNNQQHLGYFFFSPKNPEDFKTNAKIRSLPALGTVAKHYSQGGSFLYLRFTIYDSISDETFVFYLALYEVNSGTEETALEKNAQILEKRIQKMFDSFSYKINILTQDNEYWKKMYMQAKDEVREIKELIEENAKKTKKPEKALVIPPNALPFVFGILSRMEDSTTDSASFTTQLGQWHSTGAEHMSALLCGTHGYNNNYVLFHRPPAIEYLQGSTGTFLFKEQHSSLNNSSNYYQYPRALLGAFFIKNNKASNISFNLSQGGTSGWSSGYEGASTYLGTPDQNDTRRNSVSSITWSRVFTYSSNNENWTNNTNITVPANTTVCVLVYTTPFFTNGSYNFVMFSGWKVFGLRTALQNAGLELDHELTLKAVQCEGLTDFYKLWHK